MPPVEKEVWQLLHDIETGKRPISKEKPSDGRSYIALHYGEVNYTCEDGWRFTVFYDCGEWDFFTRFVTPEGDELWRSEFPEALKNYKPPEEIRKSIYGEPGYLSRWLNRETEG